jgi:hypothetical protein
VRRKVILAGHPRFEWILAGPMSRASRRRPGEVWWPDNTDAVTLGSQRCGCGGRETWVVPGIGW